MWMMGCSDGGDFGIPESFNGRKLRPLMPRTPMAPSNNTSPPPPPPHRLRSLHGNDIFSLNHHLASMNDQTKRDFHTQQVVVSSRWNPTPEQLRTLEELYRRGTRTPSTEQIQHITAQLRRYGKIEGKNVFYWFQNHKARERQKRRRQMESSSVICSDTEHHHHHHHHQQQQQIDIEMSERKEQGGGNRTGYDEEDQEDQEEEEGEQIKNWSLSTNCSTLPEQESMSTTTQKAGGAGKGSSVVNNNVAECRDQILSSEGWHQLDDDDDHHHHHHGRNATWHPMMHLSCPPPTHLINTTTFSTNNLISTTCCSSPSTLILPPKITTTTPTTKSSMLRTSSTTMEPNKLIKTNIFIAPNYYGYYSSFNEDQEEEHYGDENGCGDQAQTLQLFPLRSINSTINEGKHVDAKETDTSSATTNANFPPSRFFEFLPLKN